MSMHSKASTTESIDVSITVSTTVSFVNTFFILLIKASKTDFKAATLVRNLGVELASKLSRIYLIFQGIRAGFISIDINHYRFLVDLHWICK